jgi:tetratricopeptide (TPR) repeat protein
MQRSIATPLDGKEPTMPSVSLCVIARNAEATLATCLRSVAGLVDEIIVVDTGSTDRTKEVAASLGAGVFDFPWQDSFAAARNESLRHATGDWILWLDADEFFDEPNRAKVRALLTGLKDDNAAYVMTQRSLTPAGSAVRVQQVRLFRRTAGAVRWEYRVHEQILRSLRRAGHAIRGTDIVIHHTGYQDPAAGPGKLQRNLRLLLLDQAERPDDPFTLFNLGLAYSELGRPAEALTFLLRCLQRSHPGDSILPKLYTALVLAHERLGQAAQALAACRQGRVRCPDDPQLALLEGQLCRARGDLAGAEACWRQLLPAPAPKAAPAKGRGAKKAPHPQPLSPEYRGEGSKAAELLSPEYRGEGSKARQPLSPGGRGEQTLPPLAPLGRGAGGEGSAICALGPVGLFADGDENVPQQAQHQLALLYRDQGRAGDAEKLWRDLLAGQADFLPALAGLGELYLEEQRWEHTEEMAGRLAQCPGGAGEALVLRGRAALALGEFAAARTLLEQALAQAPAAVSPRLYLSHVLLQEGRDPAAAEQALRALLALDPSQAGAWRNLAVLLRSQGRLAEAVGVCQAAGARCPADPELLLLHGLLLHEVGELAAAEACFVRLLELEAACQGNGDAGRARRTTARHNLALVCRRQGRLTEAERHWRAALAESPELEAAWLGLGETCLMQGRSAEVEAVLGRLEGKSPGTGSAGLLRARLLWQQRDHAGARRLLEGLIGQAPEAVEPRRLLSYVLLEEDRDRPAAETALRDLLARQPDDAEARHNLEALRHRQAPAAA